MSRSRKSTTHEPCVACARQSSDWAASLPALVREHRDRLAAVARAEGLTGEEVFDVVQEAFAALLTRNAIAPEHVRGTLVALARNLARNRRRLHRVARPHVSDDALDALTTDVTPESELLAAEDNERLACCVARLADVQRAVVTLRLLDELPGPDVAVQLGLTPGHVAVLLHRARAALATCLSEET